MKVINDNLALLPQLYSCFMLRILTPPTYHNFAFVLSCPGAYSIRSCLLLYDRWSVLLICAWAVG